MERKGSGICDLSISQKKFPFWFVNSCPGMAEQQEQEYQEKFDRIFRQMLSKIDQPLVGGETILKRINGNLAIPPQSIQATTQPTAKTEQGQLIYNTISKAERIYNNLLEIERILQERKSNPVRLGGNLRGIEEVPPVPGLEVGIPLQLSAKSSTLQPSATLQQLLPKEEFLQRASPQLYAQSAGSVLPSSYPLPQQKPTPFSAADAAVTRPPPLPQGDTYDFLAEDKLSVPYTRHGIQTTVPDQTSLAKKDLTRPDSQWDQPVKQRAEVVPWNAKYPIALMVSLPKKRYFCGDKVVMDVEIINQTTNKIKKMTVTLVKRTNSYAISKDERKLNSKSEEDVHEMMVVPHGFPVPPRFHYHQKINFKIPFNVDPSVVDDSSTFEVHYFLRVRTGVPRHNGPCVLLGPLKLEPRAV
jgi:hypothetical protein